jgi:hypothetical protein
VAEHLAPRLAGVGRPSLAPFASASSLIAVESGLVGEVAAGRGTECDIFGALDVTFVERRSQFSIHLESAAAPADWTLHRGVGPESCAAGRKEGVQSMATLERSLKAAMEIQGAIGIALVDHESGMTLGSMGGGAELDMEVAAAGNTEVVRAKMRAMDALNLNDIIEDILITLGNQYHLIRLVRSQRGQGLFFYLALHKSQANLAMARRDLQLIERDLQL